MHFCMAFNGAVGHQRYHGEMTICLPGIPSSYDMGQCFAGISIAVIPVTCLPFCNCTVTWQMKSLHHNHSTSIVSSFSCFSIVIFFQLGCLLAYSFDYYVLI